MIHEEIVTFEVAKLAKEKGFPQDECGVNIGYYAWDGLRKIHSLVNSFAWYNDEYNHDNLFLAPTQSLLQRWLREEKGYYVYPFFDNVQLKWDWVCREKTGDKWIPLVGYDFHLFDTYELALEAALKYALKNLV